jgi:LEA14-like dessication related protein
MRTALLLPVVLLAGCMSYSEVKLEGVQGVRITRLDAKGISASIQVQVDNPNPYRIKVLDPDVDLYVNDVPLGKAMLDSTIVLEPSGTRTYSIPLRATFTNSKDLLPVLLGSALGGSMKFGAKGTVTGRAGLVRKRIPFEVEQTVSLKR